MHKSGIPFFRRQKLNLSAQYIKAESGEHELRYLFWECTFRCNLNCRHCGSDCSKDAQIKDMPADDFLQVANQIAAQTNPHKVMIIFTGGEPLLRKDLEHTGKRLHEMGFPWGIVTNGIFLSPQRLKSLLNAGMHSLTISLDGLEKNHNWLRGKDTFRRILPALKMLGQTRELIYDVASCVHQKNLSELEHIKEMLINYGIRKWRLFSITPIGRAAEDPVFRLNSDQLKHLMEFITNTRKEGRINCSYGCEGFLGNYEKQVRDEFFFCKAGINIASVLADGSIGACPNIDRRLIQGNIYKDDFLQIWNERYQKYRNRKWLKTGQCENCEAFKWCRGNGLHLRDLDRQDVVYCHYRELNS